MSNPTPEHKPKVDADYCKNLRDRIEAGETLTPHERQLANLLPSRPGEIRNPAGRPKGFSIRELLKKRISASMQDSETAKKVGLKLGLLNDKKLKAIEEAGGDGPTIADVLIEAMLTHAFKGNSALIKEIFDSVDGKLADKIEGDINLKTYVNIDDDKV